MPFGTFQIAFVPLVCDREGRMAACCLGGWRWPGQPRSPFHRPGRGLWGTAFTRTRRSYSYTKYSLPQFCVLFLLSNWTRGSRNSAPPPSGGITEHRPLRCKGCPAPAEGTDVTRGSSTDRGNARLAAVPNWGPPQEISTAYSACAQTLTGSRGTASNTNKQTNTQTRQGLLV